MPDKLKNKKIIAISIAILIVVLLAGFFFWKPEKPLVVSDDGLASLEIPEGALPKGVSIKDISITKIDPVEIEGVVAAYRLEPDGLELKKPAIINISMKAQLETAPDGKGEGVSLVQLYHDHGDTLELLKNQKGVVDFGTGTMTVRASISGFSSILAPKFHPFVRFTVFNRSGVFAVSGEESGIAKEGAKFYVGEQFGATVFIWHKREIRNIENKKDLPSPIRTPSYPITVITLVERGAISDLTVSQGEIYAPRENPAIIPNRLDNFPKKVILEPGEDFVDVVDAKFLCEKPGGDALDIMQYGKSFGRIKFIDWSAIFSYNWVENWYNNDFIGGKLRKIPAGRHDNSINSVWQFRIPINCLPRPAVEDKGISPAPAQPSVSEPKKTPEPPLSPPAPADSNETRCTATCGAGRYAPASSLAACSDISKEFLCTQNKQACYDYVVPKGWQNDSGCCCKDEPNARPADNRIDCSKFVGWDANGFAVIKNPKYPFNSSTLPPAECK